MVARYIFCQTKLVRLGTSRVADRTHCLGIPELEDKLLDKTGPQGTPELEDKLLYKTDPPGTPELEVEVEVRCSWEHLEGR